MSNDPLVEDIKRRLHTEITQLSESLAKGSAGTYDEYKRTVGRIQGLRHALAAVDESAKTYLYDNED